jgi:hypothetical protein
VPERERERESIGRRNRETNRSRRTSRGGRTRKRSGVSAAAASGAGDEWERGSMERAEKHPVNNVAEFTVFRSEFPCFVRPN